MQGSLVRNFTNVITLMNLVFGSLSILSTLRGDYRSGAMFILLAVLMDGMDGRVARLLNTTSELGKELDSLCDLVSFGVAPAILIYTQVFSSNPGPAATPALCLTLFFIICGALRLARFNVLNIHDFFMGIPITLAGAIMALVSIFAIHLSSIIILLIMLILSSLMVSNIKIPKL